MMDEPSVSDICILFLVAPVGTAAGPPDGENRLKWNLEPDVKSNRTRSRCGWIRTDSNRFQFVANESNLQPAQLIVDRHMIKNPAPITKQNH
jgi:hypothetical protein